MVGEVLSYLSPEKGMVILDCTIGLGGHSSHILKRILPGGRLIGIDQDEESLALAQERLGQFIGSVELRYGNFQHMEYILKDIGIKKVDGMLFDLGLSMFQLQKKDRGFSFRYTAPLDMRMDRNRLISAFDLVNNLPYEELSRILGTYGEEMLHLKIARSIVEERRKVPIRTTTQLAELVARCYGWRSRAMKIHPATRTFQALRIAVNNELDILEYTLGLCHKFLNPGARICVISFHSLEDRVVKLSFKKLEKEGVLRVITKKPIKPATEEIIRNPHSRSAKLRVAQRI